MLTARQVVDKLGGPAILARKLGISPSAVYAWIKNNEIPSGRAIQFAKEYGDVLEFEEIPAKGERA